MLPLLEGMEKSRAFSPTLRVGAGFSRKKRLSGNEDLHDMIKGMRKIETLIVLVNVISNRFSGPGSARQGRGRSAHGQGWMESRCIPIPCLSGRLLFPKAPQPYQKLPGLTQPWQRDNLWSASRYGAWRPCSGIQGFRLHQSLQ